MSKAFVKEDAEPEEDDLEPSSVVPGGKNYLTPQGHARLLAELNQILDVQRPEVVKIVSWAASNGDRSENGDYLYGKKKLRELDRRIRFLNKRLESAEIVNPLEKSGHVILFGATVTVADEEGKKRKYSIVGIDETDVARGRVSWISPIGKALLQAKKGDAVTLRTPRGDEELEILDVKYVDLP
jgi:transcription elongation factor GreB